MMLHALLAVAWGQSPGPDAADAKRPNPCKAAKETLLVTAPAKAARVLVNLSDRPPSRLRLSFDRNEGEPGHRQLVWDPFDDASLSRAITLPAGKWLVSVDAEPFPFGTAGSQPVDYAWRLCRDDNGYVKAFDHASVDLATSPTSTEIHLFSVRAVDKSGQVTAANRHTIKLSSIDKPSLSTGIGSLASTSGGASASGPLRRRALGVDAATVATQLVEAAGEVMIERAQVEGLEVVREEIQRFACERLVFEPGAANLPSELIELLDRYRPRSRSGDQPVLARTCTAMRGLRMDQLAGSGELLLRAMVQDGIQLGGLLLIEEALTASAENPAVTMLERPFLAIVDLGVAAASAQGVTDADAQRVLVEIAQAVAEPIANPARFARKAAPMLLRGLLVVAPTDREIHRLLEGHSGTWTDAETARLTGFVARVGVGLVADAVFARQPGYDKQVTAAQLSLLSDVARTNAGAAATQAKELADTLKDNPADAERLAEAVAALAKATESPAIDAVTARLGVLPTLVGPARTLADAATAYEAALKPAGSGTNATAPSPKSVTDALAGLRTAIVGDATKGNDPDAALGIQCAAGIALAVAAECQAQDGCDARAIADMLAKPDELFDPGVCDLPAVARVYDRWGRAGDFVSTSLDILSPPSDASPRSQAVAVTGLVFDLAELVAAAEAELGKGPAGAAGMHDPPAWVTELTSAAQTGRRVFAEAMAGDAKTALTSLVAYVLDRAPSWIANKRPDALGTARGTKTDNLLSRTIAFGIFASDFASAAQLTDENARKQAQKQAVRALSRATTDRTRRRSDHVFSVGGMAGPAGGYYGGAQTDDEALANSALGGLPLSATLGFALDQVPTRRPGLGWHLGVNALELGRFVDWNPDGQAVIGIANPSDILRPGVSAGITFGRPNVPLFAGVQAWYDPALPTDAEQTAAAWGAYAQLGFYVPLFDFP